MTAINTGGRDAAIHADLERTLGRIDLTGTMASRPVMSSHHPAWVIPVAICGFTAIALVLAAFIALR